MLPVMVAVLLLISTQVTYVHALELPPDLVAKLHTDLRIAFLYSDTDDWLTGYEHPLPIKYYQIIRIDINGLYGIYAYDVLVMREGSDSLATEQINIIVKFVEGGGGLIISNFALSEPLKTLLSKLGITIKATTIKATSDKIVIAKDGKIMIDHPITTGVEKINAEYGGGERFYGKYGITGRYIYRGIVTAVEIDNGEIFIRSPFIAVAKSYGNGRVIYIGGAEISDDLSGLRLGVNAVEWVAGYTPPEWGPPDTSIVGDLREENARLKGLLAGYEELKAKYESLKVDYEKLNADLEELKADYELLKGKYDSLNADYEKLMSDYQDLKSKYETAIKALAVYPELTYFFMATTTAFAIATAYLIWKKKTK